MTWQGWSIIGLGAVLLVGGIRMADLSGKLALERSEHAATQKALAREVEKGLGWKAAYEEAYEKANSEFDVAQACLEREVEAREAGEARKEILQAAQPRLRTDTEQQQVVDDATRKRAADRLNRPW